MFTSYGYLKYDPKFGQELTLGQHMHKLRTGKDVKPRLRKSNKTRFDPWWAILICDDGLSRFYRSFIEKNRTITMSSAEWLKLRGLPDNDKLWDVNIPNGKVSPPSWGPHVSLIRGEKPIDESLWGKYEGKIFEFAYDPQYINTNGKHWWFRVISPELEAVRLELGLTPQPTYIHRMTQEERVNPFHFTIGSNVEAPPSKRHKRDEILPRRDD